MKEELIKGLSKEQIAKLKECKNQDEILALAKEEGIELTEEQLDAVSGGNSCPTQQVKCPKCGSTNIAGLGINRTVQCLSCGNMFDPLGRDN